MDQLLPTPRRRRRPALSCIECRRRKIRCDRKEPCAHCVSSKIQCAYSGPSQLMAVGTSTHSALPGVISSAETESVTSQVRAAGPPANSPAPDARNLRAPVSERTALPSRERVGETGLSRSLPATLPESDEYRSSIILNKGRVSSHHMGIAKEFEPIIACYAAATGRGDVYVEAAAASCDGGTATHPFQGAETKETLSEIRDLTTQCKHIARSLKAGLLGGHDDGDELSLLLHSRHMADSMAKLYFESFESAYRILHAPSFWTEYESFWTEPESVAMDLRLRNLLVVALGSSLYSYPNSQARWEWRKIASRWILAAQNWLAGPLKKDRLALGGIQIHCLVILARQVFSIGGDLVWVSMGSLVHEAMRAGLHRDPTKLPTMSVMEAELRRRLWATVLELTAQASLDSGMPPRISQDEYDTEPPSNVNDNELSTSTSVLKSRPKTDHTDSSIQLALLGSLPTRFLILRSLNGLQTTISYADVLKLSANLTEACQSGNCINERQETSTFRRNLLDYLVRRFILALHCPFATRAQSNPLFYGSVKASLDAAMAVISPEPDERFSRLLLVGSGQFRAGLRDALTPVCFELLVQLDRQRFDGTMHRNPHYRNLLSQTLRDMITLSAERIRHGETNIKGHMFLSMILAYAEAIEAGSSVESCEVAIAQSSRDSLVFCRSLLQGLAEEAAVPVTMSPQTTTSSFDDELGVFGGVDWDVDFFIQEEGMLF